MTSPQLYSDNGSFYLIQDISGLDTYQRAKAINKFVNSGTKLLEMHLESQLQAILTSNGIMLHSDDKKSVIGALNQLKRKGKRIEILDLYSGKDFYKCEKVTTTKKAMTIVIEDNNYIQCGVKITEGECDE